MMQVAVFVTLPSRNGAIRALSKTRLDPWANKRHKCVCCSLSALQPDLSAFNLSTDSRPPVCHSAMDIFIFNIPPSCQEEELVRFLTPHINDRNISQWSCAKIRGKGCAILRIEAVHQAQSFIQFLDNKVFWRGQRKPV